MFVMTSCAMEDIRILPPENTDEKNVSGIAPADEKKSVGATAIDAAPTTKHINIMFVDVNFHEGRITEIGYCMVTSNNEAISVKKPNHILGNELKITGYRYVSDSVVVIKPYDFKSNIEGSEYGANMEDVIKDLVAMIVQCHHCFAPVNTVFAAIEMEIGKLIAAGKLRQTDVLPLYLIKKTSFTEKTAEMLSAIGLQAAERNIGFMNMYRGIFKQAVMPSESLDLSKQLEKMAACFLHLVGKGGIIYLDENEFL